MHAFKNSNNSYDFIKHMVFDQKTISTDTID